MPSPFASKSASNAANHAPDDSSHTGTDHRTDGCTAERAGPTSGNAANSAPALVLRCGNDRIGIERQAQHQGCFANTPQNRSLAEAVHPIWNTLVIECFEWSDFRVEMGA